MKYRKLLIAYSAVCGLICLLLIAMWVRSSYWKADIIIGHVFTAQIRIDSGIGFLAIQLSERTRRPQWNEINIFSSDSFDGSHNDANGFPSFMGFKHSRIWGHFESSYEHRALCVPYWFLFTSFATVAVVPWVRWRYSLRTLLIAATIVAVALTVIVALSR